MTASRVLHFARRAPLTEEGRVALEDYARAACASSRAVVEADALVDSDGLVAGVRLSPDPETPDPKGLALEVEGFFQSLIEPAPDRLGWR